MSPAIDFKKRAAGERDDESRPDAPIEERPKIEEEPVRVPAKSVGQLMLDDPTKPRAPIHAEHKRLPPLPSDRFWFAELRRILSACRT